MSLKTTNVLNDQIKLFNQSINIEEININTNIYKE